MFCQNRAEPLPVGSVKSNVGNTEGSSGLMAVLKALFALDTGYVAANMHYTRNDERLVALEKNILKVARLGIL